MDSKKLFILQKKPCETLAEFIGHWRTLYNYFDDVKYKQNIDVPVFNPTNLIELYHWKNGMTVKGSGGKEKSLQEKIINRITSINKYKKLSRIDIDKFNNDFADVSAVWRIFLLHTIKPMVYPIYDQHIHRTYNFIHNLEWRSVTNTISDKKKLAFYFNTYLPYVQLLGVTDLKALDEAFFAFGQFLNTRNQNELLT